MTCQCHSVTPTSVTALFCKWKEPLHVQQPQEVQCKNVTPAAAGKPSLASNHCQSLSPQPFCRGWITLPARWRAPGNVAAPTDTSKPSSHPWARKEGARPDSAQLQVFLLCTGCAHSPGNQINKTQDNWMLQGSHSKEEMGLGCLAEFSSLPRPGNLQRN